MPRYTEEPNTDTFLRKLHRGLTYMNQESEGKYTIGAALRKMVGMEPSEHGLHLTRMGRLTERIGTIGGMLVLAALGPAHPAFFLMMVGVKVYAAGAGFGVQLLSRAAEGAVRALDSKLNRAKKAPGTTDSAPEKGVGVRNAMKPKMKPEKPSEVDLVGARNAEQLAQLKKNELLQQQQDEGVGARKVQTAASIKGEFQVNAARLYSPKGPRPLENYGLKSNAPPKKAPAQTK